MAKFFRCRILERHKPRLIVYVDSTECSTCIISHIDAYKPLFELSEESGGFDVMLFLCNVDLFGVPLTKYLSDMEIQYPIFVDDNKMFREKNPSIPDDPRMHSIFVNGNGVPLSVGDPTMSDLMFEVFERALYQL